MMDIHLRPIDAKNVLSAFALELTEAQKSYVSHPMRSLALGYAQRESCQAFGVYAEDEMIGYAMLRHDDAHTDTLWHFMIDRSHQGKGYGRQALAAILNLSSAPRMLLTCNPENAAGLMLYRSMGFAESGRMVMGEIEMERIHCQ